MRRTSPVNPDPAGDRRRGSSSADLAPRDRGASLAYRLRAIPTLPRPELVGLWTKLIGRPPPSGLSRRLLELSVAYHLQVKAQGGLRPEIKRQLRAPAVGSSSARGSPRKASTKLPPGTRLIRQWQGRTHVVEVTSTGFLHQGQRYRSLSEIARLITGTRWSGPRFFQP